MNLSELANRQLTMLQPTDNEKFFEAKVKFTGYDDLFYFISNLIQLSVRQIHAVEDYLPDDIQGSYVDTARMLEIALQLIPHDEAKILDACMRIKLLANSDYNEEN